MEDVEARFAHLLQPIRDLTKNWEVDVAAQLGEYLEEVRAAGGGAGRAGRRAGGSGRPAPPGSVHPALWPRWASGSVFFPGAVPAPLAARGACHDRSLATRERAPRSME